MLAVSAPDGKCIMMVSVYRLTLTLVYPLITVTDNGHIKNLRTEIKTKKGLGQVDKCAMIVRYKRIDTFSYGKIHILFLKRLNYGMA